MALISSLKKAPIYGAFFIACFISTTQSYADCSVQTAPLSTATVRQVHDGDTVTLTDNRRVRLIGINTPEIKTGRNHQPLAIEARNQLRKMLFMAGNKVRIKIGAEPEDRHYRTLAHLYLEDGSSLAEKLIRQGYGWVVAVGKNTEAATCLKKAELLARKEKRGVWSTSAYDPTSANKLKLRMRGFKFVEGKITRFSESLHASWLHLDDKLALRISKSTLQNFPAKPDTTWIGQSIEARGWLYASKGQLIMNIYHPVALQHIDVTPTKE